MRRKNLKFLLIPLLFAVLLALNIGSAEAAVTCAFNNVSASTEYLGTMNISLNITAPAGERNLTNVTVRVTDMSGTLITLGTDNNASLAQLMFDVAWNTAQFDDQDYTLSAECCNVSGTTETCVGATNLTLVNIDNTDMTLTWEAATSANATEFCPRKNTIRFNTSYSESADANPTLYFNRMGSGAGYTHSWSLTRTQSSNYTTSTGREFTTTASLPEDRYHYWVQAQETNGNLVNSSQREIYIVCDSPPGITSEGAAARKAGFDSGLTILLIVIVGYFVFFGKGGK